MIRALIEPRLIGLALIALIVDQRDPLDALREEAVAGQQGFGHRGEGGGVVGVAGVNVVKQGDMEIAGDQQRQPHDPQVHALLFALAPLGERGRGIEGVDEGIEVGRMVEEAGRINLEALDERAGEGLA